MSTIEPEGWCSRAYYDRRFEDRIHEDNLDPGSIYSFIMKINGHGKLEAVQLVVTPEKIVRDTGSCAVDIAFLDMDLRPRGKNEGAMTNGIWSPSPHDPLNVVDHRRLYPLTAGIMINYDDGIGGPEFERLLERELVLS